MSERFEAGLVCYAVHMVRPEKRFLTYQFENTLGNFLSKRKSDAEIGLFGANISELEAGMHLSHPYFKDAVEQTFCLIDTAASSCIAVSSTRVPYFVCLDSTPRNFREAQ